MKRITWNGLMARYPAFLHLILLVLSVLINFILQPNFVCPRHIEQQYARVSAHYLLSAGQAVVILGGGIDISCGIDCRGCPIPYLPPGSGWKAPHSPCGCMY